MKCTLCSPLSLVAFLVIGGCIMPPGLRDSSEEHRVVVDSWDEMQEAPSPRWQYVEMEGPVCANGSPVGMGLLEGERPRELVIYLNGGGACWDAQSCNLFQTAANMDVTYSAERLGRELAPLVESGLLDPTAAVNPFEGASFAFLPYCTGDLHSGRQTTTYDSFGGGRPVHHRGAENLEHYLDFLSAEFGDVETLWLMGTSAGGYGITWNFQRFQEAFPDATIHVYADASPWLRIGEEMWAQWKKTWGLSMPAGCVMCEVAPDHLVRFLIESNPESRFAISVFERDGTLSAFMRMRPAELGRDIQWFLKERHYGENTSVFVVPGSDHEAVLMLNNGLRDPGGASLSEFLRRWAHGE